MSAEREVSPLSPSKSPSVVEPYPIEGDVYSWGRIGRVLVEDAFLAVINASRDDLFAVDLCSSLPILREIMTGQHKDRMHSEARKTVGTFIHDLHAPLGKNRLPVTGAFDPNTLIVLRKTLAPKRSEARQLLTAPIFDLMLNPPPPADRTPEAISSFLFEQFKNSSVCLDHVVEPEGKKPGDAGSWTFIVRNERKTTLLDILNPILEDKTEDFLKDTSLYFGKFLAEDPNIFRRVNFLSLDFAPLGRIVEEARKGFPEKMQRTLFFRSAQRPNMHIHANILNNPFAEKSIGFFSSIEGWPYYGSSFELKGNLSVANQLATQLALGGKAVFFPWSIQGDDQQTQLFLDGIEGKWKESGLKIEKRVFTKTEIISKIASDRELVLSEHSPILRSGENFTLLTLSKPKS